MTTLTIRERLGNWIAGRRHDRASPIPVTPEMTSGTFFGLGMGEDPLKQALLAQRQGIPELAQRAIANRIASLKWQVKRSVRVDGDTTEDEIIDEHPLTQLLVNPHPDFTGQQLFRMLGESVAAVGEMYWYKVTNAFNRPATLQPFQVGSTWPIVRNGVVVAYGQRDGKGRQLQLRREDVVRFWWPDVATLYTSRGYFGPNWAYNDTLKFQSEHMRSHFQNDAVPKVVLKAAQDFAANPDEPTWERFSSVWRSQYHQRQGTKRGLPAMLPTGWDIVQLAAQSGADVTPLLEWLEGEQLMNYGVPNALLGKVKSGDRSSAETTSWIFDTYTITPIADMLADVMTNHLARDFADDIFVAYEPFVAPDKVFELERDVAYVGAKIVSPNEVRADAGRDEASWGEFPPGSVGDQPYTGEKSQGFGGLFGSGPMPEEEPDPEEGDEVEDDTEDEPRKRLTPSQRQSLMAAFSPDNQWRFRRQQEKRFEKRMSRAVDRVFSIQEQMALAAFQATQQRAEGDEVVDEERWGLLWREIVEPIRLVAYRVSGQQTMNLLGQGEFVLTQQMVQELRRQGADLVTNANHTTVQALRAQLIEGVELGESTDQMAQRISAVFQGRRNNSRTIARTEILKATEDAQVESYRQSGVVERKRWNSNRDGKVRDSHIESLIAVVPVDQPFILPSGSRGMYPGDSSLPAADSINCRCFSTPVFEGEV